MPPGAIILSQTRQVEPQRTSEGPEPGVLETLGASFTAARADTTGQVVYKESQAYLEIANEIERLGGPKAHVFVNYNSGSVSVEGIWAEMEKYRKQGRFRELPRTREEFDLQWKARERARIEAAERTAARGNQAVAFGGGVGGAMTDPVNIYTLPLGGFGKTLWGKVLSEAVVGAGVELTMLPTIAAQRKELGRPELTAEEALTNVVMAGVGAGGLRLGGEIIGRNWGAIKAAPRDVQEKVWGAILDRTPGLRDKVGGKLDWDALDPHLADIAEATLDRTRMTDAERGAILALRREAEIDAGNPFVPDGAGTESHYRLLGETLQGIINDTPAYVPKTRPSPAARLRTGTSITSGVTGDAMQTVKARIGIVESGGRATASNPRSSAMGLYQFTDGTWLAYYKRRFGAQGLSDREIIAKKGDTGLQNTLMDDLLGDNAKALQDAGFAADPGNLYLAHFAGRGGTMKVLQADPSAPVANVLGQAVVNANPFLRGMTAADVIAWAHRKMGGKAPPVTGRAPDGAATAEADPMAALNRALADTQAEIARLDSELEQSAGGIASALDDMTPDVLPAAEATPLARPDLPARAPDTSAPVSATEIAGLTPEARAVIPELRRIVDGERGVSLNNPRALSARLGVDERNLQSALQQMAIDGLVLQGRDGKFARLPRRSASRPMDVLEYVAARGGVTPKGFSQSLMEKLPNMENPPRGHDLGTMFAVERTVRWKRLPDPARGIEGIPLSEPLRTTRSRIIPGFGPIVRNSGRGLDEIGEDLWEAGYFGPSDSVPRPTERQVIDMLSEAAAGKKFYSIDDAARAADLEEAGQAAGYADPNNPFASDFQSDEHFNWEFRQFDNEAFETFGIALDDEAFINAWGEYRAAGDGDIAGAVLRAVQREIEDIQAREIAERGMADAADIIEEWEAALRQDGFAGDGEIPAGRFDPGDPGASSAPRGPAEWEESGPLDPERWQAWDEPDSPAAAIDTDSMEHDLRVQVEAQMERAKALEAALPYEKTTAVWINAGGVLRKLGGTDTPPAQRVLAELASNEGDEVFADVMAFIERMQGADGAMGKWLDTDAAWSKIGDIEIRRGPVQALELAQDMPFDEARAFVRARDPQHKDFAGLTPADREFYPEGYTGPRQSEPAAAPDPAPAAASDPAPAPDPAPDRKSVV